MYDLLIRNVRVLDGTGAPWYRADVAVENGRIVAVGPLAGCAAEQVLDGEDQYLAPGFIDIHSHSDTALPNTPCPKAVFCRVSPPRSAATAVCLPRR